MYTNDNIAGETRRRNLGRARKTAGIGGVRPVRAGGAGPHHVGITSSKASQTVAVARHFAAKRRKPESDGGGVPRSAAMGRAICIYQRRLLAKA